MTEIGGKITIFGDYSRIMYCAKECSNHEVFVDDSRKCSPESLNRELGPEMPILPFHIKLTSPFGGRERNGGNFLSMTTATCGWATWAR